MEGKQKSSTRASRIWQLAGLECNAWTLHATANITAESLNFWLIKLVKEQSLLILCNNKFTVCVILKEHYSQTKSSVPPQDSVSELIIWKMNPLVVPVTGVKFKVAFLHA